MKSKEFTLESPQGPVSLSAFRGKWVVLYFYPKDDTPGCTIEAEEFTKLAKAFEERNAVTLGVSRDSCESHMQFIGKYSLNVRLLSDPDCVVQKEYGAWGKKILYGKPMMGTLRSTFLIDPKGEIAREWKLVKPEGHAQEVLDILKTMQ
ncbi:MAG: peroxiredoxin [Nanoarchaeota archaeon]|nr:peroxiredoxin [Nanoarchaeota archaeon]